MLFVQITENNQCFLYLTRTSYSDVIYNYCRSDAKSEEVRCRYTESVLGRTSEVSCGRVCILIPTINTSFV